MDSSHFLRQVGAIPLLSPEEEVRLALLMRAGAEAARRLQEGVEAGERPLLREQVDAGDAAREQMVQANLRLVVSVARRYTRTGVPLLDIVQDGTVGLIQAVDRFDPDQGCKFSTYAMWWIRQAVARGVAGASRTVRLPRQVLLRLNHVLGRRQELTAELGREPTSEELAADCDLSATQVRALLQADPEPMSLDLSGAAESDDVADRTASDPAEDAAHRVDAARVQHAVLGLEPLAQRVIALRFGFAGPPLGCTAVAERLGLTRERVRTIEARALRALEAAPGMADLAGDPDRIDAAS
jgi:RNA polymerase primary sigma factor